MRAARYGAIFHGGGLSRGPSGAIQIEALLHLVRELNDVTRFVVRGMRRGGNAAGADEVLAWTTGYPFAINLARGYPRYEPREFATQTMLARREVDAALVLLDDPATELPHDAATHLKSIPVVAIDYRTTETTRHVRVAFLVGKPSVHTAGTVYRADAVPLPLRPVLPWTGLDATEVLTMLEQRLAGLIGHVRPMRERGPDEHARFENRGRDHLRSGQRH